VLLSSLVSVALTVHGLGHSDPHAFLCTSSICLSPGWEDGMSSHSMWG